MTKLQYILKKPVSSCINHNLDQIFALALTCFVLKSRGRDVRLRPYVAD